MRTTIPRCRQGEPAARTYTQAVGYQTEHALLYRLSKMAQVQWRNEQKKKDDEKPPPPPTSDAHDDSEMPQG